MTALRAETTGKRSTGRREEALREGRRAVELCPIEKDALRGIAMIK